MDCRHLCRIRHAGSPVAPRCSGQDVATSWVETETSRLGLSYLDASEDCRAQLIEECSLTTIADPCDDLEPFATAIGLT